MTFKELNQALDILCQSYNSTKYLSDNNIPSELKYEFLEKHEETEFNLYVDYPFSEDVYFLMRMNFRGDTSVADKNEKESNYKYILSSVYRLVMFGKDALDMNNIRLGTININWLHKDMQPRIPRERVKFSKPTAE